MAADELYGFAIAESFDHSQVSPGDADQVEGWTVRKGVRRHEAEPAIAWHGRRRFRDNVSRRLRKARERLQRAGKIEQCQIGEDDKADIEERHFCRPFVLKRERNPVAGTASLRRQTSGGGQSRPATGNSETRASGCCAARPWSNSCHPVPHWQKGQVQVNSGQRTTTSSPSFQASFP